MNIEILRKLKALENPESVGEIKGNEKVLFAKRKNVILLIFYPRTMQYDNVVKFNKNDYEYLDEQGVREYLATKGINLDNIEVPKSEDKTPKELTENLINELNEKPSMEKVFDEIGINAEIEQPIKNDSNTNEDNIEQIIIPKKKGGRPSKK
jgi:hypothetical protein